VDKTTHCSAGQPSSFDQPVLVKISKDKRFAEKLEDIVGL
jgi:hypothetical protein